MAQLRHNIPSSLTTSLQHVLSLWRHAGLEGMRRFMEDKIGLLLAKSEKGRSQYMHGVAYSAQLPKDHFIRRLNQDVREIVLPTVDGQPQHEQGLYVRKVGSALS